VSAPTRGCARDARPDRRPSRGVVDSYGHSGATPIKLRPDALLSWTLARNCETRAKDGPIIHEAPASRDAKPSRITEVPQVHASGGTFLTYGSLAAACETVTNVPQRRQRVVEVRTAELVRPHLVRPTVIELNVASKMRRAADVAASYLPFRGVTARYRSSTSKARWRLYDRR
jgi:hypothetical protein